MSDNGCEWSFGINDLKIAFYLIRVRGKIPRLGTEFLEGFVLGIRIIRDNVLYNVVTNVYRRDTLIYLMLKL